MVFNIKLRVKQDFQNGVIYLWYKSKAFITINKDILYSLTDAIFIVYIYCKSYPVFHNNFLVCYRFQGGFS